MFGASVLTVSQGAGNIRKRLRTLSKTTKMVGALISISLSEFQTKNMQISTRLFKIINNLHSFFTSAMV